MLDLLIKGGAVMIDGRPSPVNLAIADGRITAVLSPSIPAPAARETVDADGLTVLPGLVDAHVHCRQPGFEHKENFASASRAAAAGGVTTIMVMPTDNPFTDTLDRFREKVAMARASSIVDIALQAAIVPDSPDTAAIHDVGAVSFEAFLSDAPEAYLLKDDGDLFAVMEAVAAVGGVLGVTPGTPAISGRIEARLHAQNRRDPGAFIESRPAAAEAVAVARICLAARATGARVHIRQVSTAESVAVLRALKPGTAITAEVTAHNLMLDESRLHALGPFAKVVPPLRPKTDIDAVRAALKDGVIDIVVTDHAPHAEAEKQAGATDIWAAPGGFPGLQTLLPTLLKLGTQGDFDLGKLSSVAARQPALLFNLYPRKGWLGPGADADIVLVDMTAESTVTADEQFSRARRTPFEGMRYPGRVVRTLLRGRTIYADGACIDEPVGCVIGTPDPH
ncbi:dihydroorotase family protein [Fodinicurvata sp. EGI_FJ10296]|uniref:dihydroorotase n=1 Tax=Fodinicurvata sp. EGI_FJ10296 TaxID=3231908 RepID=UPI003452F4A5